MKAILSTVSDYAENSKAFLEYLANDDQTQDGDPVKFVELVLDLVRGEGVAKGREMPFRLPIGSDAYEDIKGKCEETLKIMEEWGPTIQSMGHDN
jgi:hypothetical protein